MRRIQPLAFGTSQAGWLLRARLQHRRSARRAALSFGAAALVLFAACMVLGSVEQCGGAAVAGIAAFAALLIATAAASEA